MDKTGVSLRQDEGRRVKTRAKRNFIFTKCDDGWAGGPGTWRDGPGGYVQACVCVQL